MPVSPESDLPLAGLKVVDAATLFAGPSIATILGDFGADVIKIDHPAGDDLRRSGYQKDGVSLWSLLLSRNKRSISLKLSDPRGQGLLKELLADADVFIENFRPGTLERWDIGPDVLGEVNPGLVVVRTTGFGQTGPYSSRPGFGTLAEAMSGFAHTNGYPDGPPTLPSFPLADAVAGMAGTYAVMFALWWRDHGGGGAGQVIDLSLFEPLFCLQGVQAPLYDQLGIVQGRSGNRLPFTAPRNLYRTRDGTWLALSSSSQSVAERVMRIVGRPDLVDEPWFADASGRLEHVDELDDAIEQWIAGRGTDEVLRAFEQADAAIAPVLSIEGVFGDPHYRARETLTTVTHPRLGPVTMPNVTPRLSRTPGRIRHPGLDHGEHNEEVFVDELGLSPQELTDLRGAGVI